VKDRIKKKKAKVINKIKKTFGIKAREPEPEPEAWPEWDASN